MSDEYVGKEILSYYSTGCKAYTLKVRDKKSGKVSYVVKAKGIRLTREAVEKVNHNTFKVMDPERVRFYIKLAKAFLEAINFLILLYELFYAS